MPNRKLIRDAYLSNTSTSTRHNKFHGVLHSGQQVLLGVHLIQGHVNTSRHNLVTNPAGRQSVGQILQFLLHDQGNLAQSEQAGLVRHGLQNNVVHSGLDGEIVQADAVREVVSAGGGRLAVLGAVGALELGLGVDVALDGCGVQGLVFLPVEAQRHVQGTQ